MKPIEARRRLHECARIIAAGEPLPPILRGWLTSAMVMRTRSATADLDRLLGLRSRSGGRLHAFSKLPDRDAAIRELAGDTGPHVFFARLVAWRAGGNDPALAALARDLGPLPSSLRQIRRILAGDTAAGRLNSA